MTIPARSNQAHNQSLRSTPCFLSVQRRPLASPTCARPTSRSSHRLSHSSASASCISLGFYLCFLSLVRFDLFVSSAGSHASVGHLSLPRSVSIMCRCFLPPPPPRPLPPKRLVHLVTRVFHVRGFGYSENPPPPFVPKKTTEPNECMQMVGRMLVLFDSDC